MPVATPTAFAALTDFLKGGLGRSAAKSAPSDIGAVTVVGAGTGSVTPAGTLDVTTQRVTTAAIDVLIGTGGTPGTATFQWRINGGAWSAAATSPAPGPAPASAPIPAPLGTSGLSALFDGTLTAADTWSFTVVSCIQVALDTWNARMDSVYLKRLGATPATWDALAVQRVVDASRLQVLTERGFNPDNQGDKAMADAAKAAMAWFDLADDGKVPLLGDPTVSGVFGGTVHEGPPPLFDLHRRRFVGF